MQTGAGLPKELKAKLLGDHHLLTENIYIVRKRALLYVTELFTFTHLIREKITEQKITFTYVCRNNFK